MCEYTDRRNTDSWECPCPYRDRCERFSRNNEDCGNNYSRQGQGNCSRNRSNRERRNGCGICSLFRGCCNR